MGGWVGGLVVGGRVTRNVIGGGLVRFGRVARSSAFINGKVSGNNSSERQKLNVG